MQPFDVLVIETSYLTAERNLILFLLSFDLYFANLKPYVRLVVCINSGEENTQTKRHSLIETVHSICSGYNIYIFDCDQEVCARWRSRYGINARPDLTNLSHGHVICEYLLFHANNVLFTMLCHSDIEFTGDMFTCISNRQQILSQENVAAVATWSYPARALDLRAECMDSGCSLWKTQILNRYAIERGIEMGGLDLRKQNGLFYDTGAYLQEQVKKDFIIVEQEAPVKHWGGVTSYLLSKGSNISYEDMFCQVSKRIKRLASMSDHIARVVNSVHGVRDLSFLELGTGYGLNFQQILCTRKKSVDINGRATYCMTTDAYFDSHKEEYDLVFIDADHSYKQVIKDFNHSLAICKRVVLIHDLYPRSAEYAVKEHCGDSYKFLYQTITMGIPIYTLDCDSGLSFIPVPAQNVPYSAEIDQMTYTEFEKCMSGHTFYNLEKFIQEFNKAVSFDKFGTINRYPYAIPPVIRMQSKDTRLLIFYICVCNNGYLRMMVLSLYSLLKNTDASRYVIKVYLGKEFANTPEEQYITSCGIEVILVDTFEPRYSIPFREENNEFEVCINMDCDAFALPFSGSFFQSFLSLRYPICCGLINETCSIEQNMLVRQFQSKAFSQKTSDEFLAEVKKFLSIDINILNRRLWSYGFICAYRRVLLEQSKEWRKVFDFVSNILQTTCDETSTMLFYLLSNESVFDITDKIQFSVGVDSYSASCGLVHPILGYQCNEYDRNIALIRKCVDTSAVDINTIPDANVRKWYAQQQGIYCDD